MRHGTRAYSILSSVKSPAELGTWFGNALTAHEVDWLVQYEWAQTAEDILWRRTKFGLGMAPEDARRLESHLAGSLIPA